MTSIKLQLDERKREFQAYSGLLIYLEKRIRPSVAKRIGAVPTPEIFKAMKATAFLMLYNIIEATIVGAMAELYKSIDQKGHTFPDVTEKIQDIWIDQKFWFVPNEATPTTYRDRAAKMLRETMEGTRLTLDARQLRLGGSIDADKIRILCGKHGWKLVIHRRAKGGVELGTVKEQRNALAHGEKTFIECGQGYTVSDIERISRECFMFLGGFIRSVERFSSAGGYRKKSVAKTSSH